MENGKMMTSCSIEESLQYILFLTRHISKEDVPNMILIVLLELNFQPNLDGFEYLRDSIERKVENRRQRVNAILMELASMYEEGIDYSNIEQSIRHCIRAAWRRRDEEKWIKYLTSDFYSRGKPSNAYFISQMACLAELWQSCQCAE